MKRGRLKRLRSQKRGTCARARNVQQRRRQAGRDEAAGDRRREQHDDEDHESEPSTLRGAAQGGRGSGEEDGARSGQVGSQPGGGF